jgi:hypothetical protein
VSLFETVQNLANQFYDRALTLTDHVKLTSIASVSISTQQSVETIGQRIDQMVFNSSSQ